MNSIGKARLFYPQLAMLTVSVMSLDIVMHISSGSIVFVPLVALCGITGLVGVVTSLGKVINIDVYGWPDSICTKCEALKLENDRLTDIVLGRDS